ncbi:MAG: hypothetical protein CL928_08180 [Deltaproteobacteria bacterium]|nr:hypothetical protein [Deltaproteobacteria bacterium]
MSIQAFRSLDAFSCATDQAVDGRTWEALTLLQAGRIASEVIISVNCIESHQCTRVNEHEEVQQHEGDGLLDVGECVAGAGDSA